MDILTRTKLKLMTHKELTFYSLMAMQMEHVLSEDVPTAANKAGIQIRYNPQFLAEQTPEQVLGLMVHEVLHTVYMHMFRRQNRDHRIWNCAADYAINWEITQDMGLQIPEEGLLDSQYAGMTAEQIYELLLQDPEEQPENSLEDLEEFPDDPPQDPGNPENGSGVPAVQRQQAAQKAVEQVIMSAALLTQGIDPALLPGSIQVFLDSRIRPKVPWKHILHRYLTPLLKSRYSLAKPNKRFLPAYLPRLMAEQKKIKLAVAWDMSGSLTDTQSCRFLTETLAITKTFKAELTLLQFDTTISTETRITSPRDFSKLTYQGRGGTHLDCLVKWAEQHHPQALLVFTDGYFHMPRQMACPVVWLIIDNPSFTAPYGKVIHLEKSV